VKSAEQSNANWQKLTEISQFAIKLGASGAAIISVSDIIVDAALADNCREPRCANYGLSKNCPPHVPGPAGMNKILETFDQVIIFKIDVPTDILYSSQNREIFRTLHEMAADIEKYAVHLGFTNAKAYAGGSCKTIFCDNHNACRALGEHQKCRHSDYARPSMSGFGINVAKLFEAAGWTMTWRGENENSKAPGTGTVSGLVLVC
jgi:predicted metal-binding protein